MLIRKLLNQEFQIVKLKSSLRKFYGRHHELVDRYGITVSQMISDMFLIIYVLTTIPFPFHECDLPIVTIYRICNNINTHDGYYMWSRIYLPFRSTCNIPQFWWDSCCLSLVLYVVSSVVYLSVCLFILAMALSVYFQFLSLTVPLVSFVPLLLKMKISDLMNFL